MNNIPTLAGLLAALSLSHHSTNTERTGMETEMETEINVREREC